MLDFKETFNSILTAVKDLAVDEISEYKNEVLKDVEDFLNNSKGDLEEWAKQLTSGDLSADDLEWLIQGKKDVLKLRILKQKGLSQVRIDKFRDNVLDKIKNSILDII